MKKIAAVLLILGTPVSLVFAQDEKKEPPSLDPAEMQKLFDEYAGLAPEHGAFKTLVGKWKTASKVFYENPTNPPVSEGTAEFELLLDGRFVQQKLKTNFGGKPFEGLGITGFDKAKKKYVGIWVDNAGTGIMHTVGTYNEKSKTMMEVGHSSSPLGEMKMRMITKTISDDEFVFTMYMQMPGAEEMKGLEIKYTRIK